MFWFSYRNLLEKNITAQENIRAVNKSQVAKNISPYAGIIRIRLKGLEKSISAEKHPRIFNCAM
jgi:hypothetical protein